MKGLQAMETPHLEVNHSRFERLQEYTNKSKYPYYT